MGERRNVSRRGFLARSLALAAVGGAGALAGGPDRLSIPIPPSDPNPRPGLDYWIVDSRQAPQVLGTDSWPYLRFRHGDGPGSWPATGPECLRAMSAGRPIVLVLHGNRYSDRDASDEVFRIAGALYDRAAIPRDAVVVAFDWPSERVFRSEVRDLNEKGRRATVAGFHLARFLSAFPDDARVCLMGHSHGAKAALAALHLLGGGTLRSFHYEPEVALPWLPPRKRYRAILVAAASDHNWLDPGERFGLALPMCEGMLNLHNSRDLPLFVYPLGRGSDGHGALGRGGLGRRDLRRLGPLACRVEEHNLRPYLGRLHVFVEAMTHPEVAGWVAPYTFAR